MADDFIPYTPDFIPLGAPAPTQQAPQNSIVASLGKTTGIGPPPGVKEALASPGFGTDESDLARGYRSVGATINGVPQGLPEQSSLSGKLGQTVGMLLKNPATQALAATIGVPEMQADPMKEWQAINEAIGATKTSVRIPKSAASIEEAVTMPARGLQNEGLTAKSLSKMNPMEQQAAVAPKWNAAGKAVDQAAIDATAKNVTLNPSKSALQVAGSIQNPALQEKAVQQLSNLMQEVGINNASQATPLETLQLRRALQSGARFGPNGDLSSLGGIRAKLYQAVSKDLSDAIPGFSDIDQHYSDLNSAMKAINNSVSKFSVKTPPTMTEKLAKIAPSVRDYSLAGGGIIGSLYAIYKAMK